MSRLDEILVEIAEGFYFKRTMPNHEVQPQKDHIKQLFLDILHKAEDETASGQSAMNLFEERVNKL